MATRLTATLVDQLVERIWDDGSADLTKELAVPLPVTLIAEILGVPSSMMADFRRWSDALVGTLAAELDVAGVGRSEERRVGKKCVSKVRSRGTPEPVKKKKTIQE